MVGGYSINNNSKQIANFDKRNVFKLKLDLGTTFIR